MRYERFKSGETLTETLAAVLIGAVAIIALVSAVVGASHINFQARQTTTELWGAPSSNDGESGDYGELGEAEGESGTKGTGQITITRQDNAQTQTHTVDLYGDNDVISYQY